MMEALQAMAKTQTLPKRTETPVTPVTAKTTSKIAKKGRQVQDFGTQNSPRSAQKLATPTSKK